MAIIGDSVICAALGWLLSAIAVVSGVMITSPETFPPPESWPGLVFLVIVLGAPFAFVTWLLLVLPLYIWVAEEAALWRPAACGSIGVAAGAVAYVCTLRFICEFGPNVLLSAPHLVIGAINGAAIFTVGGWLKRNGVSHLPLRWMRSAFDWYDNVDQV